MIEVEVLGAPATVLDSESPPAPGRARPLVPGEEEVRRLCTLAAGALGVSEGHLAVEFVDEQRITALNERYRELARPTDVLSFPVDGSEPLQGARELGDIVICVAHTADVREAIVHGVLHLVGMDHETDHGEMLALQGKLLDGERA
jgi:probable rRNA maturation factor